MANKDRVLHISRLAGGGLITNYYCSSRCGHCLYGSSPAWPKEYMTPQIARTLTQKVKSLGCFSVHIGGGEPFLNFDGLTEVLKTLRRENLAVQYIETNSSWFKDAPRAVSMLEQIRELGVDTLLLSISPFHNAYVPYYKVKAVTAACARVGLAVLPWIRGFVPDLERFPDDSVHPMTEYRDQFGPDYLRTLASRYGVSLGGRALKTFRGLFKAKTPGDILAFTGGCPELADISHFHFDLEGKYVPGLCSGICIDYRDVGAPLAPGRYPLVHRLYNGGVGELYRLAREEYGFKPRATYISKCDLCFHVRRFLVLEARIDSPELAGSPFYVESEI